MALICHTAIAEELHVGSKQTYSTIQSAVDAASSGDVIIVDAGNYTESVNVEKRLTLQGEGADVVMVQPMDAGDYVFNITADSVNISGFTTTSDMAGWCLTGIYLDNAEHCNITNNKCLNHWEGICLSSSSNNTITNNTANSNYCGISLGSSSNNTITDNTVNSNDEGICLGSSSNNTIANNTANSNDYGICLNYFSSNNTLTNNTANSNYFGIVLCFSSNNTLTNNTVKSNQYAGISLGSSSNNTLINNTFIRNGLFIENFYENTVKNNTVNDKPLVYLEETSDIEIQDAGQIILMKCSNITMKDLDISHASIGIELWQTNDCKILNNTANSNYCGISLGSSSNNTITNNTANSSHWEGICLSSSSNNTITNNTANSNSFGISLGSSSNNTITNNTAKFNDYGTSLGSSGNNTITNNTANSNSFGISLGSSSNNTLMNNTANSNYCKGISLGSSSNNMLTDNTVNSNYYEGIFLDSSSNNTLMNNIVTSNDYGIYLNYYSSNNFIYNNYFNNTNNALSHDNNIWNIKKTAATNIIGGTYLGGNYWSDYGGKDTDVDGLGDTQLPYNSSGNIRIKGDYHPLVQSDSLNEIVPIGSATMDINDTIVVPNTIANATNIRQMASDLIPEHGVHSIAEKKRCGDTLTKSHGTAR